MDLVNEVSQMKRKRSHSNISIFIVETPLKKQLSHTHTSCESHVTYKIKILLFFHFIVFSTKWTPQRGFCLFWGDLVTHGGFSVFFSVIISSFTEISWFRGRIRKHAEDRPQNLTPEVVENFKKGNCSNTHTKRGSWVNLLWGAESRPQRWLWWAPVELDGPSPVPPVQTRPGSASSSSHLTPQNHAASSGSCASDTGSQSLSRCTQKLPGSGGKWGRSRKQRKPWPSWLAHLQLHPCRWSTTSQGSTVWICRSQRTAGGRRAKKRGK